MLKEKNRKEVNMKIISNEEHKRLKTNQKIIEYLARGFMSNQISLSFELAIINILEQFNINEIEIPFDYINNNKHLTCEIDELNHNFKVKIEKSDK